MSTKRTLSVSEARKVLPSLIERAAAGEVITLTRRGVPVAKLVTAQPAPKALGLRDVPIEIADDFDEPDNLWEDA